MDIREDKAWLLQSRFNPFPVSGALAWATEGSRSRWMRMPARARSAGSRRSSRLEDIASRIRAGETVVAFDYALDDCAVTWPITGGGAMMIVRTPGGRKWVVSYDAPGREARSPSGCRCSRAAARPGEWKKALAEAGA